MKGNNVGITKTLLIIMVIALMGGLSAACGESPAVAELSEDEVLKLYNKAREAYEWFDMTTIPFDGGSYIDVDGIQFCEVIQPGIDSKQALSDYLNEFFIDDITEDLMTASSDRYIEYEGKLYVLPADRGTDTYKGEESYEVDRISEEQIKLTDTVEIYDDFDEQNVIDYEQYDFFLEYSDGRWRFKNFELVR